MTKMRVHAGLSLSNLQKGGENASMTSIPTALPAAVQIPAAASAGQKGARGKHALDFAGLFGNAQAAQSVSSLQLSTQQPAASANSSSVSADLLAQLTAQLQSGTPLSQLVDQISQSVGNAVAQQLKSKLSSSDLNRLTQTVTQSIASALSPPSNGPPGTAADQAAALAARLQQLVESLARDTQNEAGQQNELSGTILDANPAKDIPAQQQTNGTSGTKTSDVSSIVRSLLATALSAFPAQGTVPAATPTLAASAMAAAPLSELTPMPAPAPAQSQTMTPSNANATPITMTNAPDLLARMLVRAAGADAAVNGSAAASAGSGTGATQSASPSTLAARFAALLGENASALASGTNADGSGSNGASTSGNSGHSFQQTDSQTFANAIASAPPTSMSQQVQNALNGTAPAGSTVDANAVIEQMVRGMVMRTDQQGTSEIRLSLQPENLGNVSMKLTVTGTQVSATVVAQNADVGNTIVANHQQLSRSLAEAGLTLTGLSVDVSGGDANSEQQPKDQTGGFGRRYTVHEIGGAAATAETPSDQPTGPQLISSSSLALFNYLA
jgi:flagellar hook-length control protein FliK